jgi:putative peptide zinc metalloprotease protein
MSDAGMESGSWYRIAGYRPRLRRHARIYRQQYRGRLNYMLQDRTSGRYHVCSPPAYFMMSLMDGAHSVEEIWNAACAAFPDETLQQGEVLRLLSLLHNSDVLHGDVPADVSEQTERGYKQSRRKTLMRFLNPLAIRIPLLDPDGFLEATSPWLRWVFTPWAALVYIAVLGYALVQAGANWDAITGDITNRVLATENLLVLFLVYPFVKAIHELGHGYAVKRWGGEVHEIGVMFLVFIPVPYVDASAATAYPVKWQRALVAAAGILVELLLASLALFVWLAAEDGLLKAFAYNTMLIGGISTLLFNGNPLLRFDGYYVLQDILEIPNLGTRSTRHIAYLVKRYLLSVGSAESPANSRWESRWMTVYGIASFIYRIFIMTAIVLFVASQYFVVGVLLAIWAVILMLGLPLLRQLNFLLRGPALRGRRTGAIARVGAALASVAAVLMLVPLPYSTVAQGVIWMPGESAVYSRAEGIVEALVAGNQQSLEAGDPVLRLSDPFLDTEVDVHRARVRELELRRAEQDVQDRVNARIVDEQLKQARADLERAETDRRNLQLAADADGVLLLPRQADLPGSFIRRGEVLGYLADFHAPIVRVVVPEDAIDQVRNNTRSVEMRSAVRLSGTVPAQVLREVPSLSDTLPTAALSAQGGGPFTLDPQAPEELRALERVFNIEVAPATEWPVSRLGMRVHVKFRHGWEPLGFRLFRATRRVFLKQLNV